MTETPTTAPFELTTKGMLRHLKECGASANQIEAAETADALVTLVVMDPEKSSDLVPLMTAIIGTMPDMSVLVIQSLLASLAKLERQRKRATQTFDEMPAEEQEKLRAFIKDRG